MKRLFAAILVIALVSVYGLSRGNSRSSSETEPSRQLFDREGPGTADSAKSSRVSVRRRIAESDTYLGYALAEGDSMLRRWRDRSAEPVTVFISAGRVPGYSEDLRSAVREAFVRWERVGAIPVVFSFVRDSTQAEVEVKWIESFTIRRTGQAEVTWDPSGWLVRGLLTIATHFDDGRAVSREVVNTVALHEIGHLLGLGHSDDPADLMYPATSVQDLTPRDRRTARLLYALPPGFVRDP
ncbi:MAG: matrixin family metalloprotease [Gemmatimonadota bacterium]|nr:MAG: matrixin family metalloprotease [Gemmatimonadota bacterium]